MGDPTLDEQIQAAMEEEVRNEQIEARIAEEKARATGLKALAQDALNVQDAVNLSGVVRSFAERLHQLRKLEPGRSTAYYNCHPVAVLFASKIASLTGCEEDTSYHLAYKFCQELVRPKESEVKYPHLTIRVTTSCASCLTVQSKAVNAMHEDGVPDSEINSYLAEAQVWGDEQINAFASEAEAAGSDYAHVLRVTARWVNLEVVQP